MVAMIASDERYSASLNFSLGITRASLPLCLASLLDVFRASLMIEKFTHKSNGIRSTAPTPKERVPTVILAMLIISGVAFIGAFSVEKFGP
jgi:hypothetical protein